MANTGFSCSLMIVLLTYGVRGLGRPEMKRKFGKRREGGQTGSERLDPRAGAGACPHDRGQSARRNHRRGSLRCKSGERCVWRSVPASRYGAFGIEVDSHLLDLDDAARAQQLLGSQAVRADGGRVHQHVRRGAHRRVPLRSGRPASDQATTPPSRVCTRAKPSLFSVPQAADERAPVWQTIITGLSLNDASSPTRSVSDAAGMLRDSPR
jgi:hypothetical protein